MDLIGEHGDYERYNMQRALEQEEEETSEQEEEKQEDEETDPGQEEEEEEAEEEEKTNEDDNGEGIDFLEPGGEQHQSLVHTDPKAFAAPTEAPAPTEPPAPTEAPAPIEPPPPPPPEPLYPETNATITDLAKQELGNWMSGGPKASEEGENNPEGEPPADNEDNAGDNAADDADGETEGNYTEPSEMDIVVPETEEEEEAIDEEIEEWEEEHGKAKPGEEAPVEEEEKEEGGETDVPQTEEEEEKVNEDIEEVEENNGKPKPGEEVPEEDNEEEEEEEEDNDDGFENNDPIETETESSVPEPASSPTVNPLVVTPSWTPPDIDQKHTLKPAPVPVPTRDPTVAPVPMPNAFATPTGNTVVSSNQSDDLNCQEYGTQTAAYLLCKNNIPPMAGSAIGLGVPLLIILCCCWRYCCGKSKKDTNSRGEYRQIANTYGDASFDNAFSEDISDDEEDLEDASWGESNGRRVLEMKNMGRRKGDDDLSLEEMNG